MAPISKLSADVLSEIFLQVAIDGYHDVPLSPLFTVPVPSTHRTPSRVYVYIALSHVCREWRRIALNTSSLWSRMVFPCKQPPEELFARSGRAPLQITMKLDFDAAPDTFSTTRREVGLVRANASRLRQVSLVGPGRGIEDYLSSWSGPVDQLEDLSLLVDNAYDTYCQLKSRPKLPLLFTRIPQALKRLAIQDMPFSWDNPLLSPTLTSLATRVSIVPYLPSAGTFEQLLNALRNMSALEFLELSSTIPRIPDSAEAAHDTVTSTVELPLLRLLKLRDSVKQCMSLLRRMTFPSETRLVLAASFERASEGDIPQLMGAIQELSARLAWRPLLSLQLSAAPEMHIKGWRSSVEPDHNLPADLEISMNMAIYPPVIRNTLVESLFSHVQSAKAERMTEGSWDAFLRCLPELQELYMRDPDSMEVLALSGQTWRGNGEDPPAPKLSILKLSRFRFGCTHDTHEDRGYDDLLRTLRRRRDLGVPVTRLELSNCTNAGSWAVNKLRELVDTVVWDEIEDFEDEEDYPEEECEDKPLDDDYYGGMEYSGLDWDPNPFDGLSSDDAYALFRSVVG